jgi:hypothetical protein
MSDSNADVSPNADPNVNSGTGSTAGAARAVRPARGRVSLFDLRWILAILFGIYGIVVTLMGLLTHAKTVTASGQDVGINVNLWTGVPMLVLGILFALWAGLRPVVAPVPTGEPAVSPEAPGGGTAGRG